MALRSALAALRFSPSSTDPSLAAHVRREIDGFLRCGDPRYGFVLLRCDACSSEARVPFTCKGRGLCPRCAARRMFEGAARLVERVLPDVPVRQWVLSLPYDLRRSLVWAPHVLDRVLRIFTDALARRLRALGLAHGIPEPRWGAVTVVHRFGASLNPHVHFHTLVLDGVWSLDGERPRWFPFCLCREDVSSVLEEVRRRVDAVLGRASDSSTVGRRTGPSQTRPMLSRLGTYELDASVRIARGRRGDLLRLCRYLLRPAFSPARCSLRADGSVVIPMPGGDSLSMSPFDLARRALAVLPPPRRHTVRYHGILAPNAAGRKLVVPTAPGRGTPAPRLRRAPAPSTVPSGSSWPSPSPPAGLSRCPSCGGPRRRVSLEPWLRPAVGPVSPVLEAPD